MIDTGDIIPGGKAKGLTLADIAKKHKVSLPALRKEYIKGVSVEKEHTTNIIIAGEIARDHLFESPVYYTELEKMEKGLENKKKSSKKMENTSNEKVIKCPVGTEVQSVLLSRKDFTLASARRWLKKHRYTDKKLDKTSEYYRFRQKAPGSFVSGTFRTIEFTDGIKAVIACPSAKKKMALGGPIGSGKNRYKATFKGKEIEVLADTSYQAQQKAAEHFKAKKAWEVNSWLVETDIEQETEKDVAVQEASKIVELAMSNGISASDKTQEEYNNAVMEVSKSWSYPVAYLTLAYATQKSVEAKKSFTESGKEANVSRIMKKDGDQGVTSLGKQTVIESEISEDVKKAREDARLFLEQNFLNRTVLNEMTGMEFLFTKTSVNELLEKSGSFKIKAIYSISEIIKRATPTTVEEITKQNNALKKDSDLMYNFDSMIMVDGKWYEYGLKTFVKMNPDKSGAEKVVIYSGHLDIKKPLE